MTTPLGVRATPSTPQATTVGSHVAEAYSPLVPMSLSSIEVLPIVSTIETNTVGPHSSVPITSFIENSEMITSSGEISASPSPSGASMVSPVTLYPSETSVLPLSQHVSKSPDAALTPDTSLYSSSSELSSHVVNSRTSQPTGSLRMVTTSIVSSLSVSALTTAEADHVTSTYRLPYASHTVILAVTSTDSVLSLKPNSATSSHERSSVLLRPSNSESNSMSLQPSSTMRPSESRTSVSLYPSTKLVPLTPIVIATSSSSLLRESSMAALFTESSIDTEIALKSSSDLQISTPPLIISPVSSLPHLQISTNLISDHSRVTLSASSTSLTVGQSPLQTASSETVVNTALLSVVAPSTLLSSGLKTSSISIPASELYSFHSAISSSSVYSTHPGDSTRLVSIQPTTPTTAPLSTSPTKVSISLLSALPSETITSELSRHTMPATPSTITAKKTSHVTFSSISLLDSTTAPPPVTTNQTGPADEVFVNHTFEMVFEGFCDPLVNDKNVLTAFWQQLREKIVHRVKMKAILIEAKDIYCNPIRISFTSFFIPKKNLNSIANSLESFLSDIHINVTISGQVKHYRAVKLNMAPTGEKDLGGAGKPAGLEEIDLIVLIAAGSFCLVLIIAGLVICIREFYHRKRTRVFELANKYQVEDFTLTKIPRPAVTYSEKGVEVHTNGHGDPHDLEGGSLRDSIHLRVNSNENGLVIGITGTQEWQQAAATPSPSSSLPESEHLDLPLVPKEGESLQSQDNPIYYIDDNDGQSD